MAFNRGNSSQRQTSMGFEDGDARQAQNSSAPLTGRWSEDELVAMIPELLAEGQGYQPYAGIGSRETPIETLDEMTQIAALLEKRGFTLRSGFAGGADTAFEIGTSIEDQREIYAPWKGFGANPNSKWDKPRWDLIRRHEAKTGQPFRPAKAHILSGPQLAKARELAQKYHPAWHRLSESAQNLHTRNMGQVLGPALDRPARFMIPYTVDGGATGGTGQAIRIADDLGIPVLNLQRPAIRAALLKELGLEQTRDLAQSRPRPLDNARSAPDSTRHSAPANDTEFNYAAIMRPAQTWDRANVAAFCKVREENGALSNMSNDHPYDDGGLRWKSSEAQYQAMRFPHRPDIQELVRAAPNAYVAKQVAYEHINETRPDWKEINVEAMAYVVTRKRQSAEFVAVLNATKGRPIAEISTRDAFWGAKPSGNRLTGQNILGAILDQSRDGARQNELPRGTTFPTFEQAREIAAKRMSGLSRSSADIAGRAESPAPEIKASMYFAFGRSKREGVSSTTTFDAILAGERTSTTRFPAWGGYSRWEAMKPGETVRFFEDKEMRGRYVDVRVTGVEPIDLKNCSRDRLEDWSKSEGWSTDAGRGYGEKYGPGVQIRYEPVPGQEILKERGRSDDQQLDFLAAAHQRRSGFSR